MQADALLLDRGEDFADLLFPLSFGQCEVESGLQDLRRISRDDRFECTDRGLEDMDAVKQPRQNPLVDRTVIDKVDDQYRFLFLPYPVDSPDTLLDLHRVPWQVIVDDCRAELEVQTFTRDSVG